MSIRPSSGLPYAGAAALLACALQACILLARGGLLPAAIVVAGAGGLAWGTRQLLRDARGPAARLRLHADGRVELLGPGGPRPARVAPCSLWLAGHVLLVLRGQEGSCTRVLLGPGNLSAGERAALWRWLRRGPGGETAPGVLR